MISAASLIVALEAELAEAKLDIDRLKMRLCDARTTLTQLEVRAERAEAEADSLRRRRP